LVPFTRPAGESAKVLKAVSPEPETAVDAGVVYEIGAAGMFVLTTWVPLR
jgi:hypothetical protein